MNICSAGHEEIVYIERECTACSLLAQIEDLENKLKNMKEHTLKQEDYWVPTKLGEEFWSVCNAGALIQFEYVGDNEDDWNLRSGNCFKTKEQAEKYKQWLLTKPYKNV